LVPELSPRLTKTVFDDFIAAAEFLIAENYTNPGKLAIFGGSNGGLLVGAVTNQRPELYAAAIPAVGVMDMLRYHKFTAGRYWVDDYGSSDDPEEFKAAMKSMMGGGMMCEGMKMGDGMMDDMQKDSEKDQN